MAALPRLNTTGWALASSDKPVLADKPALDDSLEADKMAVDTMACDYTGFGYKATDSRKTHALKLHHCLAPVCNTALALRASKYVVLVLVALPASGLGAPVAPYPALH